MGRGEHVIRIGSVRRFLCAVLVCTGVLVVTATPLASATPDESGASGFTRETATAALTSGDHEEAIRQYRALVESNERSAWAWYGLGQALFAKGERAQAASAFGLAASDRTLRAEARFGEACSRASIGQDDTALKMLEKALDAGFLDVQAMQSAESLVSLRENDRFVALVAQARANRAKVPARQFDFWMGSWEVYDAENTLIGATEITLRRNGHLVHAKWTDTQNGADSESISFYDPGRGRWRQMHIDDEGAVIEYLGGYHDDAMRLMGRETLSSGASVLIRSTYSEIRDGKLRHVLERSEDGGNEWTLSSDMTYVPSAP